MTDLIAVIVLIVIAGWHAVDMTVALIVLSTKQLIPADRGITWYFILISLLTLAACGGVAYHIIMSNVTAGV